MRKHFAFNLAFLIVANLLVKPFWIFGIDRVVQNRLGAAEYGTYFALFNYSLLFSVLLDLGLNNFNNRSIARSPQRLNSYFGNLLSIKVMLSAGYFAVAVAFAFLSGFNETQFKLLLLLLLNQALLTLILFFRSNLQALQFFKTDSFVSVSDKLIAAMICGLMLAGSNWIPFSIWGFVLAQTFALVITAMVSGVIVAAKAGFQFSFWRKQFTFKVLRATFPYALLVLLMSIYNRVDAVMLERLLPETGAMQAGIYAASYRVFDAANQFGFLFSTILLPLFAINFRKKISNAKLFDFGLKTIALFAVGVAVVSFTYADFIVGLLYHSNSNNWIATFKITMLCFIPASLTYIAGTYLTAKGELIALCKISAAGMVFNIAMNFWLIAEYGALGCAIAALATNVLMLGLHLVLVSKNGLTFGSIPVLKIAVFTAVIFAVAFVISNLSLIISFQLLLLGIAGIATAFVFNILSLNELADMLKSKLKSKAS